MLLPTPFLLIYGDANGLIAVQSWVYVTLGFTVAVVGVYAYNLFAFTPDESKVTRKMSFSGIKRKPFPWKNAPHKNLFDLSE